MKRSLSILCGALLATTTLTAIAQQPGTPPTPAENLKSILDAFDTNKDGILDRDELKKALDPASMNPAGTLPLVRGGRGMRGGIPDTSAPGAVRVNTALVPNLSAGFNQKHTQNVARIQESPIDVLFMGDSITDFWRNAPRGGAASAANAGKPVFDKYYGSMKVGNFGISGDTTQGVLWRLQNGEGAGYKPKAVMLMIGTNNTGRNTPTEIAMGIAAIVFELRKDFPDAKILLLGVFPRGAASAPQRTQIADINKIISTLHDNAHVFYLDIGPKFLAEDGSIPTDVMADALHPTTKGYEIWAEAVKEPLANLLK